MWRGSAAVRVALSERQVREKDLQGDNAFVVGSGGSGHGLDTLVFLVLILELLPANSVVCMITLHLLGSHQYVVSAMLKDNVQDKGKAAPRLNDMGSSVCGTRAPLLPEVASTTRSHFDFTFRCPSICALSQCMGKILMGSETAFSCMNSA